MTAAQAAVSDANQAVSTVNEKLPQIIVEVKKGTETLSALAEDVELIKSVAGVRSEQSERGMRGLATYADEVQKVLADQAADQGATILIEEIFGSDRQRQQTGRWLSCACPGIRCESPNVA